MILRAAISAMLALTVPAISQTSQTTTQNTTQSTTQTAQQVPLPPDPQTIAEPVLINASDPPSIVAALHDLGFRAKLTEDRQGDPKIETAASGRSFAIYFYGCKEDHTDCRDLLLFAIFDYQDGFTSKPINDWNRTNLLGAAFLDKEGDPAVQHFVAGVQDISLQSFERMMLRWELVLGEFMEFIDW